MLFDVFSFSLQIFIIIILVGALKCMDIFLFVGSGCGAAIYEATYIFDLVMDIFSFFPLYKYLPISHLH